VDGTLVPTRDRSIAAPSKNYRCSTNHQVVIDVVVGVPLPRNRNDCRAYGESGAEHAVRNATVIADGGYIATSAIIPHRRRPGEDLAIWKVEHNASHRQVRARVEHAFARMKTWKILRDCRLRGEASPPRCSALPDSTTSPAPPSQPAADAIGFLFDCNQTNNGTAFRPGVYERDRLIDVPVAEGMGTSGRFRAGRDIDRPPTCRPT
jgi:hypothetical protein